MTYFGVCILQKMAISGTSMLVRRIQGFSSSNRLKSSRRLTFLNSKNSSTPTGKDRFSFLKANLRKITLKLSKRGKIPCDIPPGCLAVYVGTEERRRYVISTNLLSHYLFKELLEKSEEEFGFHYEGGVILACEHKLFEHLLSMIITKDSCTTTTRLGKLVDRFENSDS